MAILNKYCSILVITLHRYFREARVHECLRERKCKIKHQYNEHSVKLFGHYVYNKITYLMFG